MEVLSHTSQKHGTGRRPMEIPPSLLVKIQRANRFNHRQELGILLFRIAPLLLRQLSGMRSREFPVPKFLLYRWIQARVRKVDIRDELSEQGFGTLESGF
jgi:hypothetical protein